MSTDEDEYMIGAAPSVDDDAQLMAISANVGNAVYEAIQNSANGTDRSKQQQNFIIGVSNLGHCRQYANLLMQETPFTDVRDKTAAAWGTALGNVIETQLALDHPEWEIQTEVTLTLPSGGGVTGHPDIVIPSWAATEEFPQGVWDLKSKDGLETIKAMGQTRQQKFQLASYVAGAIDAGLLDPDQPIWICNAYFDRSGRTKEVYVVGHWYHPEVIDEIDSWVQDVIYARANNEDAERDMPREWCWSWCEYATACRGDDTDVEGLIFDEEIIAAAKVYAEGNALERDGKKKKSEAKAVLQRLERGGSTGEYVIRWVDVGEVQTQASVRKAHRKISITPVRKGRTKTK